MEGAGWSARRRAPRPRCSGCPAVGVVLSRAERQFRKPFRVSGGESRDSGPEVVGGVSDCVSLSVQRPAIHTEPPRLRREWFPSATLRTRSTWPVHLGQCERELVISPVVLIGRLRPGTGDPNMGPASAARRSSIAQTDGRPRELSKDQRAAWRPLRLGREGGGLSGA
jgi:hypothetical protein